MKDFGSKSSGPGGEASTPWKAEKLPEPNRVGRCTSETSPYWSRPAVLGTILLSFRGFINAKPLSVIVTLKNQSQILAGNMTLVRACQWLKTVSGPSWSPFPISCPQVLNFDHSEEASGLDLGNFTSHIPLHPVNTTKLVALPASSGANHSGPRQHCPS